jgi:acetoacetyl-CoA synthetase
MSSNGHLLWQPSISSAQGSNLFRFIRDQYPDLLRGLASTGRNATQNASAPFAGAELWARLHRESITHSGTFWRRVWKHFDLIGDLGVQDSNGAMNRWSHRFFPKGKVNFAENILTENILAESVLSESEFDNACAIIACDESGVSRKWTRGDLRFLVLSMAQWLRAKGIQSGDRVAGVLPNGIEAVVAFLATSALGAVWTCCSPEFGDDAIVDRFGQTTPKLLIMALRSQYNGKPFVLKQRLETLLPRLPSVEAVVVTQGSASEISVGSSVRVEDWDEVFKYPFRGNWSWERFEWNHPLYILYSSGTTGAPKCIVHGAGGSLLQHVKEQRLHSDIRDGDRLFYFTTTGWMMWNWLVSGLVSRATIVLFDGSPMYPDPGVLWRIAQEHQVTHFGASARYYAALEKFPFEPKTHTNLERLRVLLSTGSPLLPEQFQWLYQAVKKEMHLTSISGGTDIVSCFVLGNPLLPVYSGEIQCKGLGMDVQVVDEAGAALVGQAGELVCKNAFPSMPLGFWQDPDGARYRKTYWERYPGVWWHGDWALETRNGGMIIYGRSDATLNPGGVRIGTAEIYRQLEGFPEIVEAAATAWKHEGDEKIVLFIKLRATSRGEGGSQIDAGLEQAIRQRIKSHCSPRHVPAWIVPVEDLPKTMNGKLSELAVRNAITGLSIGNVGALANPECLEFFKSWRPDTKRI